VVAVAFSPDGTRVATGSDDGAARVFEAGSGVEVCRLAHDGPVVAVAFSPDGTRVATGSHDGAAWVFEAGSGAEVCRLAHDGPVVAVAFSPDGTRVATGSHDGAARVWAVSARDLIEQARARLSRNLSRAEWVRYRLGDYRKLRDDLP
jgi:WD40 repeat protein